MSNISKNNSKLVLVQTKFPGFFFDVAAENGGFAYLANKVRIVTGLWFMTTLYMRNDGHVSEMERKRLISVEDKERKK